MPFKFIIISVGIVITATISLAAVVVVFAISRGYPSLLLNVHRNHKVYWGRGEGGGGGHGVGGREEGDYRYTVTIRTTSALRWATMRAIFMFH